VKELGWGATEPLIGGAKNSARPRCIHLIRLIRAGFEPFRARDIAGHYQIIEIASLIGRSKSTGHATCTARLKTGAGQSKRLALSSTRRVFRPTDQGLRHAVLLAPKLVTDSLITDYFCFSPLLGAHYPPPHVPPYSVPAVSVSSSG
jgi:hypothetical protein